MKATGSTRNGEFTQNIHEAACELCGFKFQFTPIYSPEYKADSVASGLSLMLEVARVILVGIWSHLNSIFLGILWILAIPCILGLVQVSILTAYSSQLIFYGSSFPHIYDTPFIRYYVVGIISLFSGSMFVSILSDRFGADQRFRQIPRTPSTITITMLSSIFFGILMLIGPYITGESFTVLFHRICHREANQWTDLCEAFSDAVPFTTVPHAFVDITHDTSILLLGLGLLISGGTFGLFFARLYRSGMGRVYNGLRDFGISITRLSVYLSVPLSVGVGFVQFVISESYRESLIGRLTVIGSILIHLAIGSGIVIPSVLIERILFSRFVSRALKEEIEDSQISFVVFAGRKFKENDSPFFAICRESLIRFFVHTLVITCAVIPATMVLGLMGVLPGKTQPTQVDSSGPEQSPPTYALTMLPFELFYAHVLVPLVLNLPSTPESVENRWGKFCRKIRYISFLQSLSLRTVITWMMIRLSIMFLLTLVMVGAPVMVGRLVLGRDDLLSVSLGLLGIIATANVTMRIVFALERGRLGRQTSPNPALIAPRERSQSEVQITPPERWRENSKKIFLFIFSIFLVGIVLPLMIGLAFHIVLVAPMRHLGAERRLPPPSTLSTNHPWLSQLTPVWIVGMMLLKILIAIISIGNNGGGLLPSLRVHLDRIMRTYDREGVLSFEFSQSIFVGFCILGKPLLMRIFFPKIFVLVLGRVDVFSETGSALGVPAILGFMFLHEVVFPGMMRFYVSQKKSIRDRKYLIRTELRNFVHSDDQLDEGVSAMPPMPSIVTGWAAVPRRDE